MRQTVHEDARTSALISLLVAIFLVLVNCVVDVLPIDARFKQIARTVAIVLTCLMVIRRALPLLGDAV